jgi:hypothetical protein
MIPKKNSGTWSRSIHKTNNKRLGNYFLVESIIFLVVSIIFFVLSIIVFMLSVDIVVTLSVFIIVVESVVVVVDDPDPQAAKLLIAKTVNNFFMLMSLNLILILGKGNPMDK